MKSLLACLALMLGGCGGPCYQMLSTSYGKRCCYSCVTWPEGTWHRDGKALKGIHNNDKCGCELSCRCWDGIFGGVEDMAD